MLAKYSHASYDSSSEEEDYECRYIDKIKSMKNIENKTSTKQAQEYVDDLEDEDFQLAPKLKPKQQE